MAYKSYVQPVPSGKVTAVTSYLAVIGIVIYVVSFGLFAVADEGGQPAFGIMCALDALWPFNNHTVSPLVFFGGIINPMIAIYLSFRLFGVAEELRKKLALTICICIPITWISIAQMDYRMLIGHWAWIAGILLILSPSAETIAAGAISRCLALPLLAGLVWFGAQEAIRLPMHTPTAHDDFFYVVAWKSKMPEVCGKISPLALGREDQSSGNGFTFLRSDCYRNLAALAHDPSLCNHVNGANLELLAGSPRAKSACRSQHYTTGTAEPASGTDFFATVKELGYSDDAVSQFHYLEDPVHSMVNDSYRTIRKDPTFRARIQAAPSYDEPIADARTRPANGLEYLYQMLAIDERDVLLCDRISPNATYIDRGLRGEIKGYLRPLCYLYVAWDSDNPAVCQKMTAVAARGAGGAYLSSPQDCLANISAIWRAGTANVFYGAEPFAAPNQFQEALQQIGYTPPGGLEPMAPTSDDYVSFAFAMAQADASPEKAKLT